MGLVQLLLDAIDANALVIDLTARRWPDRPIQIDMNYHPRMDKVDIVLRSVDHVPPWRPRLHKPASTPPLPLIRARLGRSRSSHTR